MRGSELRLTLTDIAIVIGAAMSITGCWLISLAAGLIGTGLFVIAGAWVSHLIFKRSNWRGRQRM